MRRTAMPLARTVTYGLCLAALGTLPASAQDSGGLGSRAAAFDTVIGIQDFFEDDGQARTQVVFDVSGTVEVARGVQATVRPKHWRTSRGEWRTLLDQASVRYEFEKGSNWRIEAGRFVSPMGLGLIENRPNLNAGVAWYHRPYYTPLPSLGTGAPRVSLISSVYPDGVQVATSTAAVGCTCGARRSRARPLLVAAARHAAPDQCNGGWRHHAEARLAHWRGGSIGPCASDDRDGDRIGHTTS